MTLCWPFVVLVCVCVCVSVRESLCLLWRETHTKGLSTRSPTRPEVDEGMKVPEETERAVDKGGQKRTIDLRLLSREGDSEKMEAGQSRDESAFLVGLWKFRAKYTPAITCKCTESSTKVSHRLPSSCT